MNNLVRSCRSMIVVAALCSLAGVSRASPFLYTFDGVFTGFRSYNPAITLSDVGATLGVTTVSYKIVVDFDRDVSTFTNPAATWHFFYSDLLGPSFVAKAINGLSAEENSSFDAFFNLQPNLGELVGGSSVRILSWSSMTSRWRVEDWQVGQTFNFEDGAVPADGGLAVYLDGNVTLSSISAVPETASPACALIAAIALLVGCAVRRRYAR